jgi:simple sugar transport system ATP-binding protein
LAATPILELDHVWKSFRGVGALSDVSFAVYPGEVVCLLGDNGAGKSTLVKIMSGVHSPDRGSVLVSGRPVANWNPKNSRRAGIETIFQDKALAPRQTVARNIFMGREITNAFGLIADGRQAREADALLRRLGFTSKVLNVNSPIAGLSGGEQEGVAIARALYFKARLLILDEPTTALSLTQSQQVLELVKRARGEGVGIVFISHNIAHAHSVGDRFLVLDRGEIAARFSQSEISYPELVSFMETAAAIGGKSAMAARLATRPMEQST